MQPLFRLLHQGNGVFSKGVMAVCRFILFLTGKILLAKRQADGTHGTFS